MKKLFVVFAVCCSLGAYAQDVKVSYRSDLDGFQRGLLDFTEIRYAEIALDGKLDGKLVTLKEVRCTDGKFSEKEVFSRPFSSKSDTTMVLRFYASSVSPDSIRMLINFVNHAQTSGSIPLKQAYWDPKTLKSYILMETYDFALCVSKDIEKNCITYPLNTAFPVIAYTTGIDSNRIIGGMNCTIIDYCGLRDKHQNPALWYESSGIQNYVYYVMKFE